MKTIKKWLFTLSPNVYYFCRDRFQYMQLSLSGNLKTIKRAGESIQTFDHGFEFTNSHLKSYQIKSEIEGLIELLIETQPNSYIEIGTADGGTHFLVRKLCQSIELSVAIDTDIRNKLLIDQITPTTNSHYICGYSNSPKTLKALDRVFPKVGSVDVLFIDGDHSYEGVKEDFKLYQAYVRQGGLIVFHDVVEDWFQRYGRKTNKYSGGVPQFFNEIKDDYQSHLYIENQEQDGFGIGVIVQK